VTLHKDCDTTQGLDFSPEKKEHCDNTVTIAPFLSQFPTSCIYTL